jgi:recyclin-1
VRQLRRLWHQREMQVQNDAVASPTFLTAENPAQVKRNVLAKFGKALLMPVTIVPMTVAYSFSAVTVGAFNAVAQMTGSSAAPHVEVAAVDDVVELGGGEDEVADAPAEAEPSTSKDEYSKLQLLLSLDVALQLIQADRESLKRVETFAGFGGPTGAKVRDTIEEIFIVLLQMLGDKHIVPAFQACVSAARGKVADDSTALSGISRHIDPKSTPLAKDKDTAAWHLWSSSSSWSTSRTLSRK